MTLETLTKTILDSLDNDKAQDVLDIDLVGKTSMADRMIIASGTSSRAVIAMAQHLVTKLKALGLKPLSEGEENGDWVLVDAGDVIVHLFRPEVRTFYGVERIWQNPALTPSSVEKARKPRPNTPAKAPAKKRAAPKSAAKGASKSGPKSAPKRAPKTSSASAPKRPRAKAPTRKAKG